MTVMTDIEIADARVERYAVEHTTPEPPWFATLAEETRNATRAPTMMVGTLEGRLLTALVAMHRPHSVLEIGTFTGYSALSMAEALPADGRIVTCDISEEHLAIARRHIAASPYAGVIEIRSGPALDTIETLPGPFDLVFIDADKTSYSAYFEAALAKLAPDGVILVDNTLWSGRVLDPAITDPDTAAIMAFNDQVLEDDRVEVVMLTVRDGVSLIRHRQAGRAG
jgi:predicted O-methyltransferase YrrM